MHATSIFEYLFPSHPPTHPPNFLVITLLKIEFDGFYHFMLNVQ